MKITLAQFLTVIDGSEVIRITDHNSQRTLFEGAKFMCEYFYVYVYGVYTKSGRIVIEVA